MNAKRLIQVLLTVALALTTTSWSALAADVEKVESQGQAAILDGDKAAAHDKAIDDALRKAVESTVGTMISSETITENYQLISDRIYSQAEGYVRKYQVVDEKEEDGVIIVEIKAEVSVGAVSKDLDGLKTLLKRKNMPKVMIMIAEQNIGMNGPAYWWGKSGPVSMQMSVVENSMMEVMRDKGFSFVDTEVLSGTKKIGMPVSRLSDKQAMRVADLSDAQILVVGQAVAKDLGKVDPAVRFLAAQAEINARVINTDNGKIIAVASAIGKGHHLDAKFAGNQALKRAGKKLANTLIAKIAKVWVEETSGTNEIRMTVTGFKNRKHLVGFIKVLRNRVRSVKDVREKRMRSGKAVLEVDLAGETRAMATELEAKDFGGEFRIEVTEVTENSIGVKLLP